MNVADTRLCLLLHSISDLDDGSLARLLLHFGSPRALWESSPEEWQSLGLPGRAARALVAARQRGGGDPAIDAGAQLQLLESLGALVLPLTDTRYPALLRTIHDPPPLLYVRGDHTVLNQAQLAVVGSRKASPAGLRAAAALSGQAARAGLSVCSGLALGIDGAAHRGSLAAGGRSVAVLATGIDRIYPVRHTRLAYELQQSGCLVSEFPPGVPPLRHNFPRRNRLISGLSLGVLLVEAALPSGSLITAGTALEQGREVFALPWSVLHKGGAGCLRLIRDGAQMVESIEDILAELEPLYRAQQALCAADSRKPGAGREAGEQDQAILALVGFEAVSADELAQASGRPMAEILAKLSVLELQGSVARCPGGYIRK
jgi:DNA processing protein